MYNQNLESCIDVSELSFSYGKDTMENVLNGVNFHINQRTITTLIGGNGCGKTTLFNLITKNLKMKTGSIRIEGKNIEEYGHKEFAKKVAIVHQNNTVARDVTVESLVGYGRSPYISICNPMTDKDYEIVDWALEVTNLTKYGNRTVMSLSGGQRQRVWIAMALAQKTEILLLDEPTTYLDIRYQIELLEMIQRINKEYGITILMVLHDMNHAIYYSDHIIGLKNGEIIVNGPAKQVVTSEIIHQIYDIKLEVMPLLNSRFVVPIR